ncbi:hypothetical protein ACLOJK_031785 [Asimina triloba]
MKAIAAALACDQKQYDVVLITHSAHEVCMKTSSDFDLEGWNLAELFRVRCVVAAPYVVPHRYLNNVCSFCFFCYADG